MVAKGAGTEQSHLKHLNYKTTSMGCNKTAGKSYNKSTSPEAMVTMNFIGKPASASHVEGEMVGNKDAHQAEFLIMFTGIWGLTSLKTDFFFPSISLVGAGGKQQLQMHSLYPWLLGHSGHSAWSRR